MQLLAFLHTVISITQDPFYISFSLSDTSQANLHRRLQLFSTHFANFASAILDSCCLKSLY